MSTAFDPASQLRHTRIGLVLALLTVLLGFVLGGLFGGLEEPIKGSLRARTVAVRESVYAGDEAKIDAVLAKSWSYLQRAHLHGGAIGTLALGGTLLLAFLRRPGARLRAGVSLLLGAGGLGYASFWLFAAFRAPGLGSTGAAKESLSWLAVPSAGSLIVGLIALLALAAWELFSPVRTADAPVS